MGPVCASEQVTQRLVVGRVGVGAQVALPTDPCRADHTGLLESGGLSCDPAGIEVQLACDLRERRIRAAVGQEDVGEKPRLSFGAEERERLSSSCENVNGS